MKQKISLTIKFTQRKPMVKLRGFLGALSPISDQLALFCRKTGLNQSMCFSQNLQFCSEDTKKTNAFFKHLEKLLHFIFINIYLLK